MSIFRKVTSTEGRITYMPAPQADKIKAAQAAEPTKGAMARLGISAIGDEDFYETTGTRNGHEATEYTQEKPVNYEQQQQTLGATGTDPDSIPDKSRVPANAPGLDNISHNPLARVSVQGGLATVTSEAAGVGTAKSTLPDSNPPRGGSNFSSLAEAEKAFTGAGPGHNPEAGGNKPNSEPEKPKGEAPKSEPEKPKVAAQTGKPSTGRKVGTGRKAAPAGVPAQQDQVSKPVGNPATTTADGQQQGTQANGKGEGEALLDGANDADKGKEQQAAQLETQLTSLREMAAQAEGESLDALNVKIGEAEKQLAELKK